jgi:hypothetical protein
MNAKFDRIFTLLGAREGDTLLDMGCGVCPLGAYAKTRGIHVIGMTYSTEQVTDCRAKGLETYAVDYTKFYAPLEGKIDHIIIMGSSEHLNTGSSGRMATYERKHDLMVHVFQDCVRYFKKDGRPHRVFYSGLHISPKWSGSWGVHILERAYGGTLQLDTVDCDITSAAHLAGFESVYSRDATYDYYMATIMDPHHFGHSIPVFCRTSAYLFLLSVVYPHLLYVAIYYWLGYWMWMFDGNIHPYRNRKYSFASSREDRPCTLRWEVFEAGSLRWEATTNPEVKEA